MQATKLLAQADFTIANRVSEDVARVVEWAFAHELTWVARGAMEALQALDAAGSVLIGLVVWIVAHAG